MRRIAFANLIATALALQAPLQPAKRHSSKLDAAGSAILPEKAHRVEIAQGDGKAPLILETGRLGRQADAAVVATRGGTTVYATLCVGDAEAGGGDFLPMSVEYQERYSATGRTSGSYDKRDGRASASEILTCRLIDRPLRPTVPEGWCADVQVLSWVLGSDGEHDPQVLAVQACAAALELSQVPTLSACSAARVAATRTDGGVAFEADPAPSVLADADFGIVVGATAEGSVVMVEAEGSFLPEADALEALEAARQAAVATAEATAAWASELRAKGLAPAKSDRLRPYPHALAELLEKDFGARVRERATSLRRGGMRENREEYGLLCQEVDAFALEAGFTRADASRALKKLSAAEMSRVIRDEGLRADGRALDEVRPIDVAMRPLPPVHGSAVFTRGETQSLATCTLGDKSTELRIDSAMDPDAANKRFYLQYSFPPSSVGETGRTGPPGRREVGHGALAEKALRYAMPAEADFAYAVRVESLITESCGSSSMASVCGGCLALYDAGVPLTTSVAGVAMGVLLDDPANPVVLTDILGVEDALGSMDFKVAGSDAGISAFQLDVKSLGLRAETLGAALEKAKKARLHVLAEMASRGVDAPQALADSVPRNVVMEVPSSAKGKIIGKGGETIKALIADHGLTNIDIGDDGKVTLSGTSSESLEAAEKAIEEIVAAAADGGGRGKPQKYAGPWPDVDATYPSTVVSIKTFGAFVSLGDDFPGLEGLCHISELAVDRVRNIEAFVSVGDKMDVKVLGVDKESGKLKLSRKEAQLDRKGR